MMTDREKMVFEAFKKILNLYTPLDAAERTKLMAAVMAITNEQVAKAAIQAWKATRK